MGGRRPRARDHWRGALGGDGTGSARFVLRVIPTVSAVTDEAHGLREAVLVPQR